MRAHTLFRTVSDASMDSNDTPLEETLRRLKECVESAKYHEAVQQYSGLARKKKQIAGCASNILTEGACALLSHGQEKEGLELGFLLIDQLADDDSAGSWIFRSCFFFALSSIF